MSSVELAKRKSRAHQKYTTTDGRPCVGVTTVLGVMAKPALIKWANNLGLQGIDSTKYVDALARIGTLIHYLVECDCKGIEPKTDDYSPNEMAAAKVGFDKWLEWRKQHQFELIESELQLASDEHQYGGTCDIYAKVDGVPTVLDIKTSKGVFDEMRTQVIAYKHLLEENKREVGSCRIIRIGRDSNEGFEDVTIGSHELHWVRFKACLALYWANQNLKNAQ